MKNYPRSRIMTVIGYILFSAAFMGASLMIATYAEHMNSIADDQNRIGEELAAGSTGVSVAAASDRIIVIDPGHGGEDGGASASTGLLEKDLNLSVSGSIADMCVLFGVPYKMTRYDDRLLYDMYSERSDYTGHKKSLDLANRLRFTEESGAALFVGIHMNKFTDPKYSGLQVYYSPNADDSAAIAEVIQNYTKEHLQPENTRSIKAATSAIYLLRRLTMPAVLVECGFLSNPDEAARLATPAYRSELAGTVFVPLLEYLTHLPTDAAPRSDGTL